jgi:hypothetical protein
LFEVNPLGLELFGCTLSLDALIAYEGWQLGTGPTLEGGV